MMTLWCIFRSPLMIGAALPDNDDWTLSLLTNDEVLAVQKHGANPRQTALDENEAIWMSDAGNGKINLALFNLSDVKRKINCPISELGIQNIDKDCKPTLRDLWNKKDLGKISGEISTEIPPHGAALYLISV